MTNDIYHEGIKKIARMPTTTKKLKQADASIRLDNRLCGDRIDIELCCNNKVITELYHKVRGCLLCEAAANIVAQHSIGTTITELDNITGQFIRFLKNNDNTNTTFDSPWQELNLLGPVSNHKSRHQCVLLPFQAIQQALTNISQ